MRRLLGRTDWFSQSKACKLLTAVFESRPEKEQAEAHGATANGASSSQPAIPAANEEVKANLQQFVEYLCKQLRSVDVVFIPPRCSLKWTCCMHYRIIPSQPSLQPMRTSRSTCNSLWNTSASRSGLLTLPSCLAYTPQARHMQQHRQNDISSLPLCEASNQKDICIRSAASLLTGER